MIITKTPEIKNFFILNDKTLDYQPKVINSSIDSATGEKFLEIQFFCPVDKEMMLNSKCEKINLYLSKKSYLEIIAENKQSSYTTEKNKSQVTNSTFEQKVKLVERTILNKTAYEAEKNNKTEKYLELYGSFSFAPLSNKLNVLPGKNKNESKQENDKKIFGSVKKFKISIDRNNIVEANKSEQKNTNIVKDNNDFRSNYKKFYIKNTSSSALDPASIFQEPYKKKGFKQQMSGKKEKNVNNKNYIHILDNVYEGIKNEILNLSNDSIKIDIVDEIQKVGNLTTVVKITENKIKEFGSKIFIVFKAMNKQNITSFITGYELSVSDIMNQLTLKEKDVSMSVKRNKSEKSVLNIGNNKTNKLSIDIHVKKTKNGNVSLKSSFETKKTNLTIEKNKNIKLTDGNDSGVKNKKSDFKKTESIFYRSTLNINEKLYNNSKCVVDRPKKMKFENLPELILTARVNQQKRAIELIVSNISHNIHSIKIKKQRFKGNVLSDPDLITNFEGEKENFIFVSDKNSYRTFDYDIFEDKSYRYYVECLMKSGEIKIANTYFIETFEEKSDIVEINNIVTNIENNDLETKKINVTFNLKKIENESDKILKNLFGNLFDLFSADLNKIKDTQGLVYSVEIVRINNNDGSTKTIYKSSIDNEGRGMFTDIMQTGANVSYKLIPRILPAIDAISKINDKISKIGQKEVFKKVNNVFAANIKRNELSKNKTIATTGNKFNTRQVFKRGLINTPEKELETNSYDFFANSSTGDLFYIENINVISTEDSKIKIQDETRGSINKIQSISALTNKNQINNKKLVNKEMFDLNLQVKNDANIDFYMIFIKENNNVYLDGILHSTDDINNVGSKDYNYLVEHSGAFGNIEYFSIPVTKTGEIGKPTSIAKQTIK